MLKRIKRGIYLGIIVAIPSFKAETSSTDHIFIGQLIGMIFVFWFRPRTKNMAQSAHEYESQYPVSYLKPFASLVYLTVFMICIKKVEFSDFHSIVWLVKKRKNSFFSKNTNRTFEHTENMTNLVICFSSKNATLWFLQCSESYHMLWESQIFSFSLMHCEKIK